MTELASREGSSAKRLVLGFDAGCFTCSDLAGQIEERVNGQLKVMNLSDPSVQQWRNQALGENAPWVPTLLEIEDDEVRAWSGWRMGWALGRAIGPTATWRVMQALGEIEAAPRIEQSAVVGKLPGKATEAVVGVSRGQFLKGVGGAAVAMSILSGGALFPSVAEAATTSTGTPAQQRLAKSIVRNSRAYKALAARQAQIGAQFNWSGAIVKVRSSNFAVVYMYSPNPRRDILVHFFVRLDKRAVFYYQGAGFSRAANGQVLVTRLLDGTPKRPHHQVIAGAGYVITETGVRMSTSQFKARIDRELQQERTRNTASQTYEECVANEKRICDEYRQSQSDTCEGGLIVTGAGGLLNPSLGLAATTALGATCYISKRVGCSDPDYVCGPLKDDPPPPPAFLPC